MNVKPKSREFDSGEATTIVASESSPQSTSEPYRRIASPWHTLLMLVVGSLNAYGGVIRAANERAGLGPTRAHMYLRAMLFEFVFLALVVLGVRLRGTPLATISLALRQPDVSRPGPRALAAARLHSRGLGAQRPPQWGVPG
jgi:hypothetical protein